MATSITPAIYGMSDAEWERYEENIRSLSYRLAELRDTLDLLNNSLDHDEEFQFDDLLALNDQVNVLVAVAIGGEMVTDETSAPITFDDWDNVTQPAVAKEEVVLSASEYEQALDKAYDEGFDLGLDEYERTYQSGIDDGIAIASRVLRVLNAQVISIPQD